MKQMNDPQTARCMEILSIIGDLWTLAIVMTLQESERRFNELQRAIPKVNAVTLTNRLRRLEEAGIVSRVTESKSKQSTVYGLTPFGRKLMPIVDAVRAVALDLERSGEAP
ncbi:winged helix-turn-helix transcriptional regulator [Streptomyces sp. NPDC056660]|uniref:winged helix-turn-helix transcriptional regulator n=1 Tax=Streptomyces sp. NPDC056660 TaxID=3345897 RepID=UPI00368522EB